MEIIAILLSVLLAGLLSGVAVWIVGRLGLGLVVSGFLPAFIAAFVIAILSGLINWLIAQIGFIPQDGLVGGLIHLIVAAAVLLISSRLVKGVMVQGFVGAFVAAIAIGVIGWLAHQIAALLPFV